MRIDATVIRQIYFYLKGNQRLGVYEEFHSLSEINNMLERILTKEIEGFEVQTDGALKGIPFIANKNSPFGSLKDYIKEKISDTSSSFTYCKHEVYFNPFRTKSTRTHFIEITHGIKLKKDGETRIPYEGIFVQFETKN